MKAIAMCMGLFLALAGARAAQEHPAVEKGAHETSAQDLQQALGGKKKILVIDVRSPQEFATGHIPGAMNIPLDQVTKQVAQMKIPKNTLLVTTCEHGGRSSRAALELEKQGYKTASFCTLDSWKKCGYKIDSGNAKP